jgi:hypothetical protein
VLPVVTLAACRHEAPPTTRADPTPPAPPSSTIPPATSAFDAGNPGSPVGTWIVFDPKGDHGNMHTGYDGPPWFLSAPKLPALDRSGSKVAVPSITDTGLVNLPDLTVRFLDAATDKELASSRILDHAEFDKLAGAPLDAGGPYDTLAAELRARIAKVEGDLARDGYVTLDACAVAEDPYDMSVTGVPCPHAQQHVKCPGATAVFDRVAGTIALDGAGGKATKAVPAWKHAPVVTTAFPSPVAVNACLVGAWVDVARTTFVLDVGQFCQVGGDWCTVQDEWHVLRR